MEKLRSLGVKEVKADLTLECTGLISKGFDGLKYEVSSLSHTLSSDDSSERTDGIDFISVRWNLGYLSFVQNGSGMCMING